METKVRRIDLDIAKGIGIILVVLAHAEMPNAKYITQFHMPFFFFISGMLFSTKDTPFWDYVKRKAKSLLYPFWFWNVLFYPVFFILYYWKQWEIKTAATDLLNIACTVWKVPFLGATWFLASLFWVAVIIKALYKAFGKMKYGRLVLLVFAALLAFTGYIYTFPFRLSRTFVCSSFYIVGFLYNNSGIHEKISDNIKYITSVAAAIIYFVITSFFDSSIAANKYDNFVIYYIGALCAIYALLNLCLLLSRSKLKKVIEHLSYLGRNSIGIVIWQFLSFRFVIIIQIVVLGGSLRWLTDFPVHDGSGIWWLLYTVAGVYISVLVEKVLDIIKSKLKIKAVP